MKVIIGGNREARRAYGFDEIALVPGRITINSSEVDVKWSLAGKEYKIPIMAAAMDGVVDVKFAIKMGELGGLAVLNLEGVQTRYEYPDEVLEKITSEDPDEATKLVQKVYKEPIKEELISRRIKEIKDSGCDCIVSAIPQRAEKLGKIAQDAGCDIFVIQSTVASLEHISDEYPVLDYKKFCRDMNMPVIVGNCVTYDVAMDLMQTGAAALLVGIGPGAACTTRGVLGIGVPQVTATCDVARARDDYFKKTERYVPVITDGGMRTGGDICKAFASGADSVMIGSSLARAKEAPGRGYHWGMATPHYNLPRGTRIYVGSTGTLEEILLGPARVDDGSQNLIGALQTAMGSLGAKNISQMQKVEIIIAPSIQTEGKLFQRAQRVGMGK
ncbi:MAG: GuaB3 family IMP dehydrogenase-related protein [Candidatus Kaelpia imicola]|nr:GuaB3 family IMP dehydrogenase-related protein [Candidatus Kaelpia imicola]